MQCAGVFHSSPLARGLWLLIGNIPVNVFYTGVVLNNNFYIHSFFD
jgi:hypothetical protein